MRSSTCMHAHIHVFTSHLHAQIVNIQVHAHAWMFTHIHVCEHEYLLVCIDAFCRLVHTHCVTHSIHVDVCTHECVHIYLNARSYSCMHILNMEPVSPAAPGAHVPRMRRCCIGSVMWAELNMQPFLSLSSGLSPPQTVEGNGCTSLHLGASVQPHTLPSFLVTGSCQAPMSPPVLWGNGRS